MTRRELVKAAIAHREAERIPYFIDINPDAWEKLKPLAGDPDPAGVFGRRRAGHRGAVVELGRAGRTTGGAPTCRPRANHVVGVGSYKEYAESIKRAREANDKYLLVRIYGSHFEKANFARGIEGFLADIGGNVAFARRFLTRIIDRNMVMLENMLTAPEIDGVLLGSDWGSQKDLLMSPESWHDLIRPASSGSTT